MRSSPSPNPLPRVIFEGEVTLKWCVASEIIALFTVSSAYLHYNKIKHVCEAISGYFVLLARNCLASTLDYIVMQIGKTNREKGY